MWHCRHTAVPLLQSRGAACVMADSAATVNQQVRVGLYRSFKPQEMQLPHSQYRGMGYGEQVGSPRSTCGAASPCEPFNGRGRLGTRLARRAGRAAPQQDDKNACDAPDNADAAENRTLSLLPPTGLIHLTTLV